MSARFLRYDAAELRDVAAALMDDLRGAQSTLARATDPEVWSEVILDWLAQRFEPGRRYSERMVNLTIGQVHADTAALRRYLVDEGFMAREGGEYWRIGGTTEP